MAGLNEGPKPTAWEAQLQKLQAIKEKTGSSSVTQDGVTVSDAAFPSDSGRAFTNYQK